MLLGALASLLERPGDRSRHRQHLRLRTRPRRSSSASRRSSPSTTSTPQIEAVGNEAKEMLGRTPGNITAIKPMRDGVIADFEAAERMLGYFISKAHKGKRLRPPARHHRRAVGDHAGRAPRGQGQRLPREGQRGSPDRRGRWRRRSAPACRSPKPSGNMIVDIGGGTTDIAVLSLAGIVYSKSVRVAGNAMDEAITLWVAQASTTC